MRTNENKKKKNQPDNGAGSTSGCGMIVFILPSMPAHSHAIKICQHSPASSASVHADAIPRFASPPHSCRAQPMPALPPRSHSSPPLTAPQPRRHTRGVFTCTHVSNGCRYCRWFGGFLRHGIMCTLYSIAGVYESEA